MRDPETGNSKGFAFINFASFDAADAAIEAMNGQHLCNRPISISYAFKKDAKGERHGSAAGQCNYRFMKNEIFPCLRYLICRRFSGLWVFFGSLGINKQKPQNIACPQNKHALKRACEGGRCFREQMFFSIVYLYLSFSCFILLCNLFTFCIFTVERLLASQNPLAQADKPHQLFADAPPTQMNAFDPVMMMAGGVPPPPTMPPPGMCMFILKIQLGCIKHT